MSEYYTLTFRCCVTDKCGTVAMLTYRDIYKKHIEHSDTINMKHAQHAMTDKGGIHPQTGNHRIYSIVWHWDKHRMHSMFTHCDINTEHTQCASAAQKAGWAFPGFLPAPPPLLVYHGLKSFFQKETPPLAPSTVFWKAVPTWPLVLGHGPCILAGQTWVATLYILYLDWVREWVSSFWFMDTLRLWPPKRPGKDTGYTAAEERQVESLKSRPVNFPQ